MSDVKPLATFRDLPKAKPQPKQTHIVVVPEASTIPSPMLAANISGELSPKPIPEAIEEHIPETTKEAIPERTEIPFRKPFEISSGDRAAVAYPDVTAKPSEERTEPYQTLESTHTGSEQKLYGFLYRQTISKGKRVFQATQPYIRKHTGISGPNTLRRAIRSLSEKLSIRVLNDSTGDRAGTEYYVFNPKEITAARREAGIFIHPVTKDVRKRLEEAPAIPSVEGFKKRTETRSMEGNGRASADSSGTNPPIPSGTDLHDKYNINPPVQPTSSGSSTIDDDKLPRVRKLFEQLSNGGTWREDRDLKAYEQVAHLGIWHIILGICFSQDRCPEHHISSLAYCVPAILKHAEDMAEFPESYLIDIAYKSKRKIMQAIETGRWQVEP